MLFVSIDTTSDKAEAKTISLPASYWEQIEDKVGKNKGARSQYLQELIKADLDGRTPLPQTSDAETIMKLAQAFAPTACKGISQWLSPSRIDQPHLLAQCLIAIADNVELIRALEREAQRLGTTLPEVLRLAATQFLTGNDSKSTDFPKAS